MQEIASSDSPYYLIALGLSDRATQVVADYRKTLWKKTGNMSFLCLPAIIPIIWSHSSFHSLKQEKFQIPPTPLNFTQISSSDTAYFLTPDTNQLDSWSQTVRNQLHMFVAQQQETPPFPASNGIFLGTDPEKNIFQTGIQTPDVINTSWHLQQFRIVWKRSDNQVTHVHHRLLSNQHLT